MFNFSIIPRFQGVQNCIQSRQQVRIGRVVNGQPALLEVGIIPEDCKSEKIPYAAHTSKLELPDGDVAYFREKSTLVDKTLCGIPFPELFLHDRGAYVLSQQLGLKIIPETDLVDLQDSGLGEITHHYGAITDAIKGQNLDKTNLEVVLKRHPVSFEGPLNDFSRSLVELYLYIVVAHDADKAGRNILYSPWQGELKSIDNECSGSTAQIDFPDALNQLFHGQPIPEEYRQRLQQFVDPNVRNEYTQALLPYYDEQTIQGMFKRAERLLDKPQMWPIDRIK